jgi:ABC-type branched-subunit amino acid transport system ATPase component
VQGVIEAVRNLKDLGKTVCLVEHSIHTMSQLADHILFMDRGQVIASGSLADLMNDPELTEIYFGA